MISKIPTGSFPSDGFSVQGGPVKPKLVISSDASKRPILIVGAGLAGVASALALSRLGLPSILLDQRTDENLLGGAGINLQAKAVEALNKLGISTSSLLDSGTVITKQSYYFPDGRHVCTLDKRGNDSTAPGQIAIHRGKLLQLLLNKAASTEGIKLLTSHRVVDVNQTASSESISLEAQVAGTSTPITLTGSLVLGADGFNSSIRDKIIKGNGHGRQNPLRYHGITDYRGVVDNFPSFLDGSTMILAGGLVTKAVVYPIGSPCKNGRQTVNWVVAAKEDKTNSSASSDSHRDHILDLFSAAGLRLDFLDLSALISSTESIRAWPMVDLDPLQTWTEGRIGLVGDAAHAMLPVGSGGAMASFFDALALHEAFERSGNVPASDVLHLYQSMRYKSASKQQQTCRLQPAEHIVQDAMDSVPISSNIPADYGDRIREVMKSLHKPLTAIEHTNEDKRGNSRPAFPVTKFLPFVMVGIAALAATLSNKLFVSGLQNPSAFNIRNLQRQHLEKQSMTKTKAGGSLMEQLSIGHSLSPLERIALTSSGDLQVVFSAYHLQPVAVSVNRFEKVTHSEELGPAPLAVYEREVNLEIADHTFCRATSKVKIFSAEIVNIMSTTEVGIGQLLAILNLRPTFTLHDAGRNNEGGLWRMYSLDCDEISMDILEDFSAHAWNTTHLTTNMN